MQDSLLCSVAIHVTSFRLPNCFCMKYQAHVLLLICKLSCPIFTDCLELSGFLPTSTPQQLPLAVNICTFFNLQSIIASSCQAMLPPHPPRGVPPHLSGLLKLASPLPPRVAFLSSIQIDNFNLEIRPPFGSGHGALFPPTLVPRRTDRRT